MKIIFKNILSNQDDDITSVSSRYFLLFGLIILLSIIFSGSVSANTSFVNNSQHHVLNSHVTTVDPANNSLNIKSTKQIKVSFSNNIKKGTGWIQLKNNKEYVNITKNINSNYLKVNHSKPLKSGKYTLILHTGAVETQNGRSLPLYVSKFTVDNIPPKIRYSHPSNGYIGYSKQSGIYIKFNEAIQPGSNYKFIRVINLKTGKTSEIKIKIINNSLFIKNFGLRSGNTWYQVIVPSKSIMDMAGNNLNTVYSFKFKTRLKDLQFSPLNPAFKNYLRSSNTLYGSDILPSTIDFSQLQGNIFPETIFPTNYDLRTLGRVTSVKNQNPLGTCWTFATMGSLESCLLPSEYRDFSENNLKNNNGFDMIDQGNYGGTYDMATAYLARWYGPVNDIDDPYNVDSDVSPYGIKSVKHVQNVMVLPYRTGHLDNNNIKYAITQYGAVATEMFWDDSYYNEGNHSYYSNTIGDQNHGICIVGWDDNYNRYNFNTAPAGNGAFIVKNSWGTGWGDNGYFYVSYYDTKLGTNGNRISGSGNFVFYNAEQINNFNRNYQYDDLGWVRSVGYESNTAWFSNIFTSKGYDIVDASSFYVFSPNSTFSLYAYLNPTGNNPRSGTLMNYQTGKLLPGYHTIIFNNPFSISSGQKFSVVIQLTTPGFNYPVPVECALSGYSSKATAGSGQSYMSENGVTWTDTYTDVEFQGYKVNVCLKAFTIPDYHPKVVSIDPDNGVLTNNPNQDIKVTFSEHVSLGSGAIELKSSSGTLIPITTSIINDVLTVHPESELMDGVYTLILHTGSVKYLEYDLALFTSSFTVDATQPTVKELYPANKSFTVPGKDIKITFSEPIVTGTEFIELKNSLGTLVPITTYISDNILVIHPVNSLTSGSYYLTIQQGSVVDQAGNLVEAFISSFTVDCISPKISSVDPLNNAVNVNPNKVIKIMFSELIKLGNCAVELQNIHGIQHPALTVSGNVLYIRPNTSLSGGLYTLSIYPGCITDIAGNVQPMFSSYFTVDSIRPTITVTPQGGLYNTSKVITLKMSEPGYIYFTTNGKTPTISSIKYSKPFVITSNTIIKCFAQDKAGNTSPVLIQNYVIDKIAPKVLITTPVNLKTGISRTNSVIIKFTEKIRTGTYFSNISIKNISTTRTISTTKKIIGNNTVITPTARLMPNTWYRVTVPAKAIKDYAGNNLQSNYIFRFKTGL